MQTAWAEDLDSELLLVALLHGPSSLNSACPILTVLFCCVQPELTFILIDLQRAAQAPGGTGALVAGRWLRLVDSVTDGNCWQRRDPGADCAAGMCGDVNLFVNDPEEKHSAEIEVCVHIRLPLHSRQLCQLSAAVLLQIMVAEHASRGRGLAQEALTLMMAYAYHHLVRLAQVQVRKQSLLHKPDRVTFSVQGITLFSCKDWGGQWCQRQAV